MSLNNPQDSVCDYLAELLYDADDVSPPETLREVQPPKESAQHRDSDPSPFLAPRQVVEVVKPSLPDPVKPDLVKPDPVKPDPVKPEPVKPEPVKPEPAIQSPAENSVQQPDDLDREKLNRLLSSAQFARTALPLEPKTQTEPSAKQIPIAPMPASEFNPIETVEDEILPAVSPHQDAALQWCDNGRPQWAQERFDVLLFKVYGLTLAVPLIALGQIQPIDDQLTPLFGQADWFMGIQPTPMGKIKTVNTALFVMPERYNEAFLKTAKYVISIHGVPWGLAVDSVEQPKTLSPDDVKWRTGRTQRPWLAGTVKEFMCALIDIPNMADLLNASDKNSRKARP